MFVCVRLVGWYITNLITDETLSPGFQHPLPARHCGSLSAWQRLAHNQQTNIEGYNSNYPFTNRTTQAGAMSLAHFCTPAKTIIMNICVAHQPVLNKAKATHFFLGRKVPLGRTAGRRLRQRDGGARGNRRRTPEVGSW